MHSLQGMSLYLFCQTSICTGLVETCVLSREAIRAGRWYTLFTYMFIHANYQHLLFNMFVLGACGYKLENLAGRSKFIILYIISGLVGGLAGMLFTDNGLIGSSGAVYGIIGAMLVIAVINRDKMKYYLSELIVVIVAGMIESLVFMPMSMAVHMFGFLSGAVIIILSRRGRYRLL